MSKVFSFLKSQFNHKHPSLNQVQTSQIKKKQKEEEEEGNN